MQYHEWWMMTKMTMAIIFKIMIIFITVLSSFFWSNLFITLHLFKSIDSSPSLFTLCSFHICYYKPEFLNRIKSVSTGFHLHLPHLYILNPDEILRCFCLFLWLSSIPQTSHLYLVILCNLNITGRCLNGIGSFAY